MATSPTFSPATAAPPIHLRKQYDNYIGGRWIAPQSGHEPSVIIVITAGEATLARPADP